MIKDTAPPPPGRNAAPLVGESSFSQQQQQQQPPPPAYTPSPYFQGLPYTQPQQSVAWTPAPSLAAADRRARARFFKALLVGFLLYAFALALFGGGVEDALEHSSPPNKHHGRHRAGRPIVTVAAVEPTMIGNTALLPAATEVVAQDGAGEVLGE